MWLARCFLVQGGEPPVCFAKPVVDYSIYDAIQSETCVDNIPDYEVKQLVLKVIVYELLES